MINSLNAPYSYHLKCPTLIKPLYFFQTQNQIFDLLEPEKQGPAVILSLDGET